ncbi:hypothetical protein GCM10010293_52360 [Streptomyces griseoflavus]|nr:hypothetical protein GCM10010293_52360 [Streptomyces griseoflavus]
MHRGDAEGAQSPDPIEPPDSFRLLGLCDGPVGFHFVSTPLLVARSAWVWRNTAAIF